MDISSKREGALPFKLTDIAAAGAGDSDLAALKDMVERGEIAADAPCDGMHSEWSQEQKKKLDGVLRQVFHMK